MTLLLYSWGRILAATGSIPLKTPLDPTRVSVSLVPTDGSAPLPLLTLGEPEKVDEERASEILALEDFEILVDLGGGDAAEVAQYWTCDFSYVSLKQSLNSSRLLTRFWGLGIC